MAVPGDVHAIIEVSIVAVAEASSGLCRMGGFVVSKSGVSPIGRIIFSCTNFFSNCVSIIRWMASEFGYL